MDEEYPSWQDYFDEPVEYNNTKSSSKPTRYLQPKLKDTSTPPVWASPVLTPIDGGIGSLADALSRAANESFGSGVKSARDDFYGGVQDAGSAQATGMMKQPKTWFDNLKEGMMGIGNTPAQLLDMYYDAGDYVLGGLGEAMAGKEGRKWGERLVDTAIAAPTMGIGLAYRGLKDTYLEEKKKIDSDSMAFFLGDVTGNILMTVATMGAGGALSGANAARTIATAGGKLALQTTAERMATGAIVNSTLGLGGNYQNWSEGKMSTAEYLTRAGIQGVTGGLLSGPVGKLEQAGEEAVAKFVPYSFGKQMAADALTNAGQAVVTDASVDLTGIRDISAEEYGKNALMAGGIGAGFGAVSHGVPKAWEAAKNIANNIREYRTSGGGAPKVSAEVQANQLAEQRAAAQQSIENYIPEPLKVASEIKSSNLPSSVKKIMSTGTESDLTNLKEVYERVTGQPSEGITAKQMVSEVNRVYVSPADLPSNLIDSQSPTSKGQIASDMITREGTAKDDPLMKAMADIEVNSYIEKFATEVMGGGASIPNESMQILIKGAENLGMEYPTGAEFTTQAYLKALNKAIRKDGLSIIDSQFASARNEINAQGGKEDPSLSLSFLFRNNVELSRESAMNGGQFADNSPESPALPQLEAPELTTPRPPGETEEVPQTIGEALDEQPIQDEGQAQGQEGREEGLLSPEQTQGAEELTAPMDDIDIIAKQVAPVSEDKAMSNAVDYFSKISGDEPELIASGIEKSEIDQTTGEVTFFYTGKDGETRYWNSFIDGVGSLANEQKIDYILALMARNGAVNENSIPNIKQRVLDIYDSSQEYASLVQEVSPAEDITGLTPTEEPMVPETVMPVSEEPPPVATEQVQVPEEPIIKGEQPVAQEEVPMTSPADESRIPVEEQYTPEEYSYADDETAMSYQPVADMGTQLIPVQANPKVRKATEVQNVEQGFNDLVQTYGEPREDNPAYIFHRTVMDLAASGSRGANFQDPYVYQRTDKGRVTEPIVNRFFTTTEDGRIEPTSFEVSKYSKKTDTIRKALEASGVNYAEIKKEIRKNGYVEVMDGAYTAHVTTEANIVFTPAFDKTQRASSVFAVYEKLAGKTKLPTVEDFGEPGVGEHPIFDDKVVPYKENTDGEGDRGEKGVSQLNDWSDTYDTYKSLRNLMPEEWAAGQKAKDTGQINSEELKTYMKTMLSEDAEALSNSDFLRVYAKVAKVGEKMTAVEMEKLRRKSVDEDPGKMYVSIVPAMQMIPGLGYVWSQSYEDDEVTPLGVKGSTLKTIFGAASLVLYGRHAYRFVNTIRRGVDGKKFGTGSTMRKVIDSIQRENKFPSVGKEIDNHTVNLHKAGYGSDPLNPNNNMTPEQIQAERVALDKAANKGIATDPYLISETSLYKKNDVARGFDKQTEELRLHVERDKDKATEKIHEFYKQNDKKQTRMIKAVAVQVDYDIATIKNMYPEDAWDSIITHYKDNVVEQKYFKEIPELYAKYNEFQSALDDIRLLHVKGMAIAITGEMPESIHLRTKELEESSTFYEELVAKAQQDLDELTASGESQDVISESKKTVAQLTLEHATVKNTLEKFRVAKNLETQTVRDSYMSRWHNKSMPFEVRVKQQDSDPGYRVGFNTKEEAEQFATVMRSKNAEFIEVGRGTAKLAEEYAKEDNMRKFLDNIISAGDPDDVISAYDMEGIVDALSAYSMVKSKIWVNDAIGRQVMDSKGRVTDNVYRKDLMNLYISLSSPEGANPFAYRQNVQGYMPMPDPGIKDEGKRLSKWMANMEEHFDGGLEYMLNYYDRVHLGVGRNKFISDITNELNKMQVGSKLVQWFDYYRERMSGEGHNIGQWQQRISAIAISRALWGNLKSPVTNLLFGGESLVGEGIARYGATSSWITYPANYIKSFFTNNDVGIAVQQMKKLGLLGGGYARSIQRLEGNLPFAHAKIVKKGFEVGFWATKYTEYLNNRNGSVLAVTEHLKYNPGDIDGAIVEAMSFNKDAQGRYNVEASSHLEYMLRNKNLNWVFTLTTPAIRNQARVFANMQNVFLSDSKARAAASVLAHIAGATFIAGIGGIAVVGDYVKANQKLKEILGSEDGGAITKENRDEELKRKTELMFRQAGFKAGTGIKYYDALRDGGVTFLTGKNFTNDASVQGMVTNPVVLSTVESWVKAAQALANDPASKKSFFRYADAISIELSRATRAVAEMSTPYVDSKSGEKLLGGSYLDSDGNSLRGGYVWTDAISEIFFGRSSKDYKANEMRATGGGGIYSKQDAVEFSKRLARVDGLKVGDGDVTLIGSDEFLANEFRTRLLFRFDAYEKELEKGYKGVDNVMEKFPSVVRISSSDEEQYGKNNSLASLKKDLRRAVRDYYTNRAVVDTYVEIGLTPPESAFRGMLPGDVVSRVLVKKFGRSVKNQIEQDRLLQD